MSLVLISNSLSKTERRLAAEIEDLKKIHDLSIRLGDASTLSEGLIDVLKAAVTLVDASLGSVQLLDDDGRLEMVGQVGFGPGILDEFAFVTFHDCSTCS